MHTVEGGVPYPLDSLLSPSDLGVLRLSQLGEHIELGRFFLSARRSGRFFLVFPEEMPCPFRYRQQTRLFASYLHQVAEALKICPKTLGDLARRVVFKRESASLILFAFGFAFRIRD